MITRLEVIDFTKDLDHGGGRTIIVSPTDGKKVTYDIQDDGRTLKVFVDSEGKQVMNEPSPQELLTV